MSADDLADAAPPPEPASAPDPAPDPEPEPSQGEPPDTRPPAMPAEPPVVALPDLRIEISDPAQSVNFRQQIVIADSCEVRDGCATETGARSLMAIEFTLRNDGSGPLVIGSPWDADIYEHSSCNQAYIPALYRAELRNAADEVVSRGSLATTCIETASGSYTCGAQGIGPAEGSAQPKGKCDFLDVTDLPAGDYQLSVTVNADHRISESNFDNNTSEWTVRIDPVEAESCGHITCGAACCDVGASCDNGVCTLPDLRVNYDAAASTARVVSRFFEPASCELEEECVGGSGSRRLLLFEGRLENWGPGDLNLGPQEGNPLFTYSSCHGHYHTSNFAEYLLRNQDGSLAAAGHKQGYCLSDMSRIDDPDAVTSGRPPEGRTTPCNHLTAGYADVYDTETPCQWIDVTDVAVGNYVLEVTINPDRHIAETDTGNNTIRVPVTID